MNHDEQKSAGLKVIPCAPPNFRLSEYDTLNLNTLVTFLGHYSFHNKALASMIQEIKDTFEDIIHRGEIGQHVDGYGHFTIEVKVEREE